MMKKRKVWKLPKGQAPTAFDLKIMALEDAGHQVPPRRLILNEEQIAGVRRSAVVNTGILDMLEEKIREGMTTEEIDKLVYNYTISLPHSTMRAFLRVAAQASTRWCATAFPTTAKNCWRETSSTWTYLLSLTATTATHRECSS